MSINQLVTIRRIAVKKWPQIPKEVYQINENIPNRFAWYLVSHIHSSFCLRKCYTDAFIWIIDHRRCFLFQ